jgi:mannitol-1-phosphate/altronate dehydrogenase
VKERTTAGRVPSKYVHVFMQNTFHNYLEIASFGNGLAHTHTCIATPKSAHAVRDLQHEKSGLLSDKAQGE